MAIVLERVEDELGIPTRDIDPKQPYDTITYEVARRMASGRTKAGEGLSMTSEALNAEKRKKGHKVEGPYNQ